MALAVQTKTTTLFSLEAVKAWLKVNGVDTADDTRLVIAADAASAEFEAETDWFFVTRSLSKTFSGNGKSQFIAPWLPIASIDSFTIDGSAVDPDSYVIDDPESGIVTFTSGALTAGVNNIALTGTVGYDAQDGAALPSDVYRAGLDLMKAIYDELTTGAIAATSVSLGGATMVVKAAKRPPSVQRVIDLWTNYRP